jgi:TRAP transporter TAXI family solute receptor
MARWMMSRWASLDFWVTWLGALGLIAGAFWLASRYIQPAPPKRIVMTVGAEGGAYERLAKEMQLALAQNGITLDLRTTQGAREDLQLLNDPDSGVVAAVVQGGVASDADGENLMSLAALYREPVWVFYRQGLKVDRLSALLGKRLSIGPQGSGTRTLSEAMLKANGVDASNTNLGELPSGEAARQLVLKQLDAIMVVGAPESNLINLLMRQPGLKLLSFDQAEAYSRRFPFLSALSLPRGSFNLGRNIPDHDVQLVAPTANLVVRDDIHPALVDLLLDAATDITGDAGMLRREGEFPSPKGVDIPLSDDADRYMKNGPSFLHKRLPFWIAVWADRLLVLLIPIVAVLVPVVRLAPAVYAWRVKSRLYRWYGRLKEMELDLDDDAVPFDRQDALKRLDEIELAVSHIRTPLAFSENLYNLRSHIELVRQRLRGRVAVA